MDKNTLHTKEEMIKLINQTYNTYHSKKVKLNTFSSLLKNALAFFNRYRRKIKKYW